MPHGLTALAVPSITTTETAAPSTTYTHRSAPGRQKCRQRKSDQDAVVAVEPGVQRRFVDAKPLRRQGCDDDREQAGNRHVGHTGCV